MEAMGNLKNQTEKVCKKHMVSDLYKKLTN